MDIAARVVAVLVMAGVAGTFFVGTATLGTKLYRANGAGRTRVLLWSAAPLVGGAAIACLNGPGEWDIAGLILLGPSLVVASWIAIILFVPKQMRSFTGTVLFEAVAAVAWGFALVELVRALTHGAG